MTSAADQPYRRSGALARLAAGLWTLVAGTLLSLNVVTAIIPLGWLMRRMRYVARVRVGQPAQPPTWIFGRQGSRALSRLLGGFAANLREGFHAAISVAIASAPFTLIWLFAWWAGWENSFSKGYEQAFVGPSLGLAGVAVFCLTMVWMPMALVHQAVENRPFALFELRRVRSVVRHTGWGYLLLAAATVFAALPFFASRGLVVFASGIVPGFEDMTPEQLAALQNGAALVTAGYLFVALVILRGWAARIYAGAVSRALQGPDAAMWKGSRLDVGQAGGRRSWQPTHLVRVALLAVVWFGLAAQIFVAQFLNHDWHMWITHPMIGLPWQG